MPSNGQVALKSLAIVLGTLLVLIQYPLWLGKGGWLRVWELDRQVSTVRQGNKLLADRNSSLEGEVRDLRAGLQAVEERARYELGMVRPDEVFVQFNDARAQRVSAPAPSSGASVPASVSAVRVSAPAPGR